MRTGKGLAALDEMASRVSQLPGVTHVSGVTRPTGERLDQAELAWQNCGSPEIVEGFLSRFGLRLVFPDLIVDG